MIIDSHTHVQKTMDFWDSPPERILDLINEACIDMAVIMPYSDNPELILYIHQCVSRYPNNLVGYARLDPADPDSVDILEHSVNNLGMKGLKLHPVGNLVHPAAESSIALINKAASLGTPTLFHCGDEEFTLPFQIAEAARLCPQAVIILGHMGGYFHVEDAIRAAEKYENIYLETSAMPYPEKIKDAVDRVGANRILFASDGPGCPPDLELYKIKSAKLSDNDEKLILGVNIKQLLKI